MRLDLPLARAEEVFSWVSQAACKDQPLSAAFPGKGLGARTFTESFCAHCPVAERCLEHARTAKLNAGTFGNLSAHQRTKAGTSRA